jgi:hypothetical protein
MGREYWLKGGVFRSSQFDADVFPCFMDAAHAAVNAVLHDAKAAEVGDSFWMEWSSIDEIPCAINEVRNDS